MSVWYCIPSKRPPLEAEACLSLWRGKGYRLAIFRDSGDQTIEADLLLTGRYDGYAAVVNRLCREVIARDASADWLVTGGDDVEPDLNHDPETVALECTGHFAGTFGVMQPTGDRWGEDPSLPNLHPHRTAYIDRVCGSPWMGREFCQRMYGGRGPLWDGWFHCFEDEELQAVAQRYGVLWRRPDLIHLHRHWGRRLRATASFMPAFLRTANQRFTHDQNLFREREDQGFPGHEPIKAEIVA